MHLSWNIIFLFSLSSCKMKQNHSFFLHPFPVHPVFFTFFLYLCIVIIFSYISSLMYALWRLDFERVRLWWSIHAPSNNVWPWVCLCVHLWLCWVHCHSLSFVHLSAEFWITPLHVLHALTNTCMQEDIINHEASHLSVCYSWWGYIDMTWNVLVCLETVFFDSRNILLNFNIV